MSNPWDNPGFGERGQEQFGDIPTEPEAFLEWGSRQLREAGKFELSCGRVIQTMIWTSRNHARVCANIIGELARLLDRDRFDIGPADFAVRTPVGVRSPDIVVDRISKEGKELSTSSPLFIAEVLSPSTAGTDFTAKLQEYTSIETLQTYLICAQEVPRAWLWARHADGSWPKLPEELVGRERTISISTLGIDLPMAAIFRGIPDPPKID
jgi:Uma2 family endonuclease